MKALLRYFGYAFVLGILVLMVMQAHVHYQNWGWALFSVIGGILGLFMVPIIVWWKDGRP